MLCILMLLRSELGLEARDANSFKEQNKFNLSKIHHLGAFVRLTLQQKENQSIDYTFE